MKKNKLIVKFVCSLLICFLVSVSSAVMRGMSTEELTGESDLILEGEVKNVNSYWSRDGKSIITRAVVIDSQVIRGRITQQQIIVEYEGGEIGDIGYRVSDVAPLRKGERVILFLKYGRSKGSGNAYHMVGKGQGKYRIDKNGIARKNGFSVMDGDALIDNNIPAGDLIDKIRKVK